MHKRTKIVATISDLRCTEPFIKELIKQGVNVLRLNTAHQTPEGMAEVITHIRQITQQIAILIDTKGPEIRTVPRGLPIIAKMHQPIYVHGDPNGTSEGDHLYLSSTTIVQEVPLGSSLLIDDGDLEMVVAHKDNEKLTCFPQTNGEIKPRKSVNIPNIPITLPTLSERDRAFLKIAAAHDVEFIAHSFVRTREDILEVQQYLKEIRSNAKVIAKIENQQGVDNIDQILDHAYGIMVARGDLGIEIPAERVPEVQRMIVAKCIESKKPVIIATQMLHTMIEHPRPTRAEISDVASAIYQGTDAIMLSGETASGKYPVESVITMAKIARELERHIPPAPKRKLYRVENAVTETLAHAAVDACARLPIKAIVVDTLTGRTARYLSAFRGIVPIYAMCYSATVMRQLALSYGVEPSYMEMHNSREDFLTDSLSRLLTQGEFQPDDLILVIGGSFGASNGATFMEICQARKILTKPNIHES